MIYGFMDELGVDELAIPKQSTEKTTLIYPPFWK